MEWIRRRAKWPQMLALVLLLAVTVAAPTCWDLLRNRLQTSNTDEAMAPVASESLDSLPSFAAVPEMHEVPAVRQATASSQPVVSPPGLEDAGPELPPVVTSAVVAASADEALAMPTPIAPLLEDDYALVDEPLPVHAASDVRALSNSAESMPTMAPLATASPATMPRLPLPPRELPAEPPAPPAVKPEPSVDLSQLVAARDALWSLLRQVRNIELPELPPPPQPTAQQPPQPALAPAPAPTQVKVDSSADRLAMAPPRPRPAQQSALQLVPAQPTTAADAEPARPLPRLNTPLVAQRDRPRSPLFDEPAPRPSRTAESEPAVEPESAPAPEPTPPPQIAAEPAPQPEPEPEPEPALLRLKPAVLVRQLQHAAAPPLSASWAQDALAELEPLTTPGSTSDELAASVAALDQLAQRGLDQSLELADPTLQRIGIRAARSIARRIPLWRTLVEADAAGATMLLNEPAAQTAGDEAIGPLLNQFAAITAGSDAGAAWRDYLMLDELAALASVGGSDLANRRRDAARRVMARLDSPELTDAQREFLADTPAAELAAALRPWATGKVDLAILAALIERYELRGAQRDADLINELRSRMAFSGDPRQMQAAEHLDRYYRNGNMRLAVSGELLNRLTPQPEPSNTRVRDNVAGADVRGRAQTTTQLELRLLPDPEVWRFGLEARGTVRSQTYSDTWPARVRNSAAVDYEARKLILVNRHGVHVWPAESRTGKNQNRMTGVDNELDLVPLVGPIVEGYAERQHRERRPRAMAQVRSKVQREARSRLDREADAKLEVMEEKFAQAVLGPLEQLALAIEPMEMYTTAQRAVMRMRLADDAQLGAHTPRPSAPGDSLASAQLHESALNNAARGLGLDGREFTAIELYETLAAQLDRSMAPPEADFPSRARVRFAKSDAVRVRCHDDRVELILSIAELAQGRDRITNVRVHAFFRPVVDGLSLKLVRDDTLQFDGRRLLTGPRIVLHSVFGKMLPKDQEIVILAPRVEGDPRFAGLMVTQLVIEDGWVAMALGPKSPERTAWRSETAAAVLER